MFYLGSLVWGPYEILSQQPMRARATRGMETRDTAIINTKRFIGSQMHYTSIGQSLICKLGPRRLLEAKVKLDGDHVGVINMGEPH